MRSRISRATVTAAMEAEYKKMRGELKKRAAEVQPDRLHFARNADSDAREKARLRTQMFRKCFT